MLHELVENGARARELTGLQVAERQIDARRDLRGAHANQLFVDLDGTRIMPEPEVDHAEQALPLDVARLERERPLELALRLVDVVVLEELAPAVEVEEELLAEG